MKRRCVLLLMAALLFMNAARAEGVMDQLRNMRKSAGDRILEIEEVRTPSPEAVPQPTPTPEVSYPPLESGAMGDEVRAVQQRLIELGYLTGKADGNYGARTAAAVKAFQRAAGLPETGDADEETQRRLFWAISPGQEDCAELDYAQALQHADAYEGTLVAFTGSVLQVLEDDTYADSFGVYTALRVATRDGFGDVVYVTCFRDRTAPAIQTGDALAIRGVTRGLYAYTTETGERITLPRIEADRVE